MFTGIVEDLGEVVEWAKTMGPRWDDPTKTAEQWTLGVKPSAPPLFFQEKGAVYLGASICVSGVCLTVTKFDESTMWFGVAPETIRRTRWDETIRPGATKVNLERAAAAGARNSGHYVQGHVDGVAKLVERWVDGDSLWHRFELQDKAMARFVVSKGYVAVDGTSLTVVDVDADKGTFTLMLVAYTQKHIVLPLRGVGDLVNIEVDVMAKYGIEHAERVNAAVTKRLADLEAALVARIDALDARMRALEQDSPAKRAKAS